MVHTINETFIILAKAAMLFPAAEFLELKKQKVKGLQKQGGLSITNAVKVTLKCTLA